MDFLCGESEFQAMLIQANRDAQNDYLAIRSGIDRIVRGLTDPSLRTPYECALVALNCHSGLLCGPLELMKRHLPDSTDEDFLCPIRSVLAGMKKIALWLMDQLGQKNGRRVLRRFSCKFRELFTPGWLSGRGYTARQLQRVLDAAILCARRFLVWFAALLKRFEDEYVVDDFRAVEIGDHARAFVLYCNREEGVVLMRLAEGGVRLFNISRTAKIAWRIIRQLIESSDASGCERLPPNALAHFRNTDAGNAVVSNDLAAFADYIHPAGEKGLFRLQSDRKRKYQH